MANNRKPEKTSEASAIKQIVRTPMFRMRTERPAKGKSSYNRKGAKDYARSEQKVTSTQCFSVRSLGAQSR